MMNEIKQVTQSNFPLRPMQAHEFPAVHRLMQQAFPLQEHRCFSEAKALLSKNEYEILVYAEQDEIIGFIAHWLLDGVRFVEHFAVRQSERGNGIGGGIMQSYLSQSVVPVVLEVEATGSELARRRIGFYQRLGFALSTVGYIQPCLQGNISDIPLLLMHAPADIPPSLLLTAQEAIFAVVYQKEPPIARSLV
jgi:predicted N-acetyltransferase YhbS